MVRSYVNAQLKSLGYATMSVGNGAAALSICESEPRSTCCSPTW